MRRSAGQQVDAGPPVSSSRDFLRRTTLARLRATVADDADTQLAAGLRPARDALAVGALDAALRHTDRAWRVLTAHAPAIAPVYGRLLLLAGDDLYAAIGLLQHAIEETRDPGTEALIALALLQLDRLPEARALLERLLRGYCVEPQGELAYVAGEILRHAATEVTGWVGRGPQLQIVGELNVSDISAVLEIGMHTEARFSQILRARPDADGIRGFDFVAPPLDAHAPLDVRLRGRPVLGSGLAVPAAFGLDGRARCRGARLSGWARLLWRPALRPYLRIEDEHGRRAQLRADLAPLHALGHPYDLNLRAAVLRGSRIEVRARLPDGRWQELPDAPLLREAAVNGGAHGRWPLGRWRGSSARAGDAPTPRAVTDVIIPVYRGRQTTLDCLKSVLGTVGPEARVVVIDDATDDAQLAVDLDALAAAGRINLLRNPENLGFVASVNRALTVNPDHDVVLLNSDTQVFGDWLARLKATAYSAARIATVTPLSNAGSIASYPHVKGATVASGYAEGMHQLALATHAGTSCEIPVGVGFCLFIRRDCLKAVGQFDAQVFGKGYGEEVDFCLRARRRGWSHRLAADAYVYHAEGTSFGSRRAALLERSHRLLSMRYPGFHKHIASFLAQDPLHRVRRQLDVHRLSAFQGRFVLIVTLAMSGGVARFVEERGRALRARGLHPLLLRPVAGAGAGRERCELTTDALDVPNLQFEIPKDLGALAQLLQVVRLDAVELQHFLHLDPRVIELVRQLPAPYDVFVHDYAWLCPRVTLIDGSRRYCGEPAVRTCERCVRQNGGFLGEEIGVARLRRRSRAWLADAQRRATPSQDSAARMRRHFPGLDFTVEPHPSAEAPSLPGRVARSDSVLRVALLGGIGDHKGYRVLLHCARDAARRRLPLEFVVIGHTSGDAALLATGKVFITGRYIEGEAPYLLQREQPDLVFLPSVWPETWCYALDYPLQAQIPVVAFDLGAIAERLKARNTGTLLPLGLAPSAINERLLELHRRTVKSHLPEQTDDANMAVPRLEESSMNEKSDARATQGTREEGLSASVQVLPLPTGLYLFSVKAAAPSQTRSSGELTLPAVHVGLGPGMHSEQVEFVSGPDTQGAWLFAPGDLLVTKVKGSGVTLVMTSVRAPGGEALSIKVERLESRAEAGSTAAAAPTVMPPTVPAVRDPSRTGHVPMQISAHIRARGDVSYTDVPWAGRVAPGLWVEAFCVRPLEQFGAADIEYKGLTGSGFETPWLSDDKMCGTKGMAVPLVGFAVRLKPGSVTSEYDCEYSGYFQSGVTVGPLRNGAPCRSTVANDPLEGIQVRLMRRAPLQETVREKSPEKSDAAPRRARSVEEAPARKAPAAIARTTRRS